VSTLEIAPGSILQRLYLKERIRKIGTKGTFIEFGAGTGYVSNLLLSMGWKGAGYDLNSDACEVSRKINQSFIEKGLYEVKNSNFFDYQTTARFDLLISCMVIEHLNEADVSNYFSKCAGLLSPGGLIITIVPGCMDYWGIEDEIAGHFHRYSFEDFQQIAEKHSLSILKMAGLTFPVSNLLFGLSNALVKKAESKKAGLSKQEQTILSSNRKVLLKTDYPPYFRFFLNEITMYPFHVIQKIFSKNRKSMVICCEMKKK